MTIVKRSKLYPVVILSCLALDFFWIGVLNSEFYTSQLGPLLRLKIPGDFSSGMAPVWLAALPIYLLIPMGVIEFALPKLNTQKAWETSFKYGGLFGLVLYGVYDLTNYSLLKDWTLAVTVMDITWGIILCALLSRIALSFEKKQRPNK